MSARRALYGRYLSAMVVFVQVPAVPLRYPQ
jgi:hypothetical protein